jgi:hypothetical protein
MTVASSSRWSRRFGIAAVGLVFGFSACSLSSLDGLKNGQVVDGAAQAQPAETTNRTVPIEAGTGGVGAGGSGAGTSAGGGAVAGGGGTGGAATGLGGTGGTVEETGPGGAGGSGGAVGGQVAGGAITSERPGSGGIGGGTPSGGTRGPDASSSRGSTTALSRCEGVDSSRICWYLGAAGDSCVTTCASHGGNSPQTPSHVGIASQGGSASECGRLLGLLGQSGTVYPGTRADAEGLGCVLALGYHVWLTSPAYSDNAKYAGIQSVCGCLE